MRPQPGACGRHCGILNANGRVVMRCDLMQGRIAVPAAIAAVQSESDAACTAAWLDVIVTHLQAEHRARAAARQRDDDVDLAAAGAAIGAFMVLAGGVAQIDDVVVMRAAGEIDGAHGVGREGHVAAAGGLAGLARGLQHLLDARRVWRGVERLGSVFSRVFSRVLRRRGATS